MKIFNGLILLPLEDIVFNLIDLRHLFFLMIFLNTSTLFAQFDAREAPEDAFQKKINFQLYPNPMSGNVLHVNTDLQGMMEINIINLLGEVVFQTQTHEHRIQSIHLQSGIYIVKINQGTRSGLSRLVVP